MCVFFCTNESGASFKSIYAHEPCKCGMFILMIKKLLKITSSPKPAVSVVCPKLNDVRANMNASTESKQVKSKTILLKIVECAFS